MAVKIIFDDTSYFEAVLDNKNVGTLDIMIEENEFGGDTLYWLNGIYVDEAYQRKGIATKLIRRAIKEFGKVYVSKASQMQHKQNNDNSARELCDDGALLVNKLIERKIIKRKWMINPFGEESYSQI